MNACDAVQELLTAHLMAALAPSEDVLVLDHLESCSSCCRIKDETEACVALIQAPPVKAPPQVWTKIRTRIEREAMGGDPVRDTDPSPIISLSCSFCRGGMTREGAVYCASCLAPHHPECFVEHGRCSVMGCAETRIVRPSELPPLQLHVGGKAKESEPKESEPKESEPKEEEPKVQPNRPPRRRLRRWLMGGLSVVAVGIGAAALTDQAADDPNVLLPEWEIRPTLDRPAEYRVELEQATLGELCAKIGELPGNPRITLADECRDLLVRRASIEGVHWSEALRRIAARFDLRLSQDEKGYRIDRPQDFNKNDHPRAVFDLLELDTTRLVPIAGSTEGGAIHQGWAYRLHVAPDARSVAIQEGKKLSLFQGLTLKGSVVLEAPCTDVAWARDGQRLAYVAGKGEGGQLGVFDLSRDRFTHTVVRDFPGADATAQLLWCELDERILLKTRTDLKLVSTLIGGQTITLTSPSPSGYQRFDLLPLRTPGRFLVLYPDGVEAWMLANTTSPLYASRRQFPPRYVVRPPVAGDKCVVMLGATAVLFDARTNKRTLLESRNSIGDGSKFLVDLDPGGTHVAFLKRHADSDVDELMVRPLDPRASLRQYEPESGVVQGFRWAPQGLSIAFWTEDTCYVGERRVLTPTPIKSFEESLILDVQWVRLPKTDALALAITTRGLAKRKAIVRVELISD